MMSEKILDNDDRARDSVTTGVRKVELVDMPWCWRRFGDALMLVTESGGAQVVLTPPRRKAWPAAIETRDPITGTLRPIREDDAVAKLIAQAPNARRALQITSGLLQQLIKVAEGFGELDRWKISHDGKVIANCTIAEALDMANEALEPTT